MDINLTIDNKKVTGKKGETILECALRHDIEIPHLCTHPALPPSGTCRMCVVEIEGMRGYPTSCTTPAADDMVVKTESAGLRKLRRNILALMMLEHPSACLVCDKKDLCDEYRQNAEKAGRTSGCQTCNNKEGCEVRDLSAGLDLKDLPVPPDYQYKPLDRSNPFIDFDANLCILCGRCVRICKLQHGKGAIEFTGRGSDTRIGSAFGRSRFSSNCQFCGSCVDVCPNGSLAERYAKWYSNPDNVTESTCVFCDQGCALKLETNNGKLISTCSAIEKLPVCVLGRFAVAEFLNGADRLVVPQTKVGKVLRQTEWDETIKTAADKLKDFSGDDFALVCDTTSTLEERYLFKKFTEDVMKSKNYIEIIPDEKGVSSCSLPEDVKAVVLAGNLVSPSDLENLDLLIVLDFYPTDALKRADIVFPVAVFTETAGTVSDKDGENRPLCKASDPPGQARSQWRIIRAVAGEAGAENFKYSSVEEIRKDISITEGKLLSERNIAPPSALDVNLRRTYFRGHRIEDKVKALQELSSDVSSVMQKEKRGSKDGFEIIAKHEIAPNIHEIVIKAPEIAEKAQPGQFAIVMVDETSERVPFTLCDWDAEKGTITFIILEVGQSSRKFVLLQTGDKVAHLAGPLGIPLEIKKYGAVALAAGCYGIGAVLKIAGALKRAGNSVTTIIEGRSLYTHYYTEKLKAASDEFIQTTIDGSFNFKGHAVDVVGKKLKENEKIDLVIAVGCPFMMMLTGKETEPYGVKTLAALNPIMLDGTGMCGACRVSVGDKTKFACVDGPFFDAHLIDWEELRNRRDAYSAEETQLVGRTESVKPHHGSGKHNCTCESSN